MTVVAGRSSLLGSVRPEGAKPPVSPYMGSSLNLGSVLGPQNRSKGPTRDPNLEHYPPSGRL